MFKSLIIVLGIVMILLICSDDLTNPKDEYVFGKYKVTELSAQGINYLEVGMYFEMELKSDSSFVGYMFVPDTLGLLEDDVEGDQEINFIGTFSGWRDKLNFETDADLYIRDAVWTIEGNKIYSKDFAYTVLTKQ